MRRWRTIRPRPIGLTLSIVNSSFHMPFQGVWTIEGVGGGGGGCALWVSPAQHGGAGQNGGQLATTAYRRAVSAVSIGAGGNSGNPNDFDQIAGSSGGTTNDGVSGLSGGSGGSYGGNPTPVAINFPSVPFRNYSIPVGVLFGVSGLGIGVGGGGQGGAGRSQSSGQGSASPGQSGSIIYVLRG